MAQKQQPSGGIPAASGNESGNLVNSIRERQPAGNIPGVELQSADEDSPISRDSTKSDLPLSDDSASVPVSTILLTKDSLEMLLTDPSEAATDILANVDFHAFFVKDQAASSHLDQYKEATAEIGEQDPPKPGKGMQPQDSSGLFMHLVERLRNKSPHTTVVFTVKKKVPPDLYIRARKYISLLCDRLELSDHDKKLITEAGNIHILSKLRHTYQGPSGSRSISESDIKSLRLLNEHPSLVRTLGSMYRSLEEENPQQPSFELVGSNILTIVDLYCDTLHIAENLTTSTFKTIDRELQNLIGKLFLKEIVEAFIANLKDEVSKHGASAKSNRIMIYSDHPDRIYPLKARLGNEGFKVTTTDSLDSFIELCKRRQPGMILLRLHSRSHEIVKTVQNIINKGINLKRIPAFLLVKGSIVQRLSSLFEMGIEDIIDLDGEIDILVLKIKKFRAQLEATIKSRKESDQQSGSRGNLTDMNLIDLLQAMGPSRRTARITVQPEESNAEPLLMYLAQGNIIFAQLGELLGETAIHHALGWGSGTWKVEQVEEQDLPEPNNELPNEAILMEGCRLLDENARSTNHG